MPDPTQPGACADDAVPPCHQRHERVSDHVSAVAPRWLAIVRGAHLIQGSACSCGAPISAIVAQSGSWPDPRCPRTRARARQTGQRRRAPRTRRSSSTRVGSCRRPKLVRPGEARQRLRRPLPECRPCGPAAAQKRSALRRSPRTSAVGHRRRAASTAQSHEPDQAADQIMSRKQRGLRGSRDRCSGNVTRSGRVPTRATSGYERMTRGGRRQTLRSVVGTPNGSSARSASMRSRRSPPG